MNAMLLLCDAAQICDNKLYILGGGWTLYGANSAAFAVAIKLSIDQHECDKDLLWELLLEDADGHRVMSGPEGAQRPIQIDGGLRAASPPEGTIGFAAGDPVPLPLAVSWGPLRLPANQRFVWRFTVDGETPPGGLVSFSTAPVPEPV
jgi:hypothetical protein